MIDFIKLMQEAEAEIIQTSAIKRSIKIGILFSVIQTTLETYRPTNAAGSASSIATQLIHAMLSEDSIEDVLRDRLITEHQPAELAHSRSTRVEPKLPDNQISQISNQDFDNAAKVLSTIPGLSQEDIDIFLQQAKAVIQPESQQENQTDNSPGVEYRDDADLLAEQTRQETLKNGGIFPLGAGFGPMPEDFNTIRGDGLDSVTS